LYIHRKFLLQGVHRRERVDPISGSGQAQKEGGEGEGEAQVQLRGTAERGLLPGVSLIKLFTVVIYECS
jgi:hypothetical protein